MAYGRANMIRHLTYYNLHVGTTRPTDTQAFWLDYSVDDYAGCIMLDEDGGLLRIMVTTSMVSKFNYGSHSTCFRCLAERLT
jgi:hypothetical protein